MAVHRLLLYPRFPISIMNQAITILHQHWS
jgi:hypothetical protein